MDSATIKRWIKNLGGSYDSLVANGVIANLPLQELYENSDSLEIEPEGGIELSFWAETQRFEAIHFILNGEPADGMPMYAGELPAPFSATMTRPEVRKILGKPAFSKTPLELHGLSMAGWDTYQVDAEFHTAALVDLQYADDLQVNRLIFSLIDKHI